MKNILMTTLAILVVLMTGYVVTGKYFNEGSKVSVDVVASPNKDVNSTADLISVNSNNVLNLSNKGLTKAPSYIFDQKNLEELNLSNNLLSGSLQAEVRYLQNLKVLNLSNNKFTGLPAEVGQLKNLEVLNLSGNQLTGLPNELGNLSNLKLLDLSGNNYSEQDLSGIRNNLPSSTVIKVK
jgi:Leucine-rich repeat (LRR) protein